MHPNCIEKKHKFSPHRSRADRQRRREGLRHFFEITERENNLFDGTYS